MRLIRFFKKNLAKEAETWIEKDIISQPQAVEICNQYDISYENRNNSSSYHILSGLGYLFVGLALIVLVGNNWDEIPRAIRMWSLILLTVSTHTLAFRVFTKGNKSGATGLFLLGNMFFGAAIILIAQIYHLGEHMPDGVFWWAFGILPFAIIFKNTILTLQTLILAIVWMSLEFSLGYFPLLFPIFLIATVATLYQGKESLILFFTLILAFMLFWFHTITYFVDATTISSFVSFIFGDDVIAKIITFIASSGLLILLYIFGYWLNQRNSQIAKNYGSSLSLWSLRGGLIFMLLMSVGGAWEELLKIQWSNYNIIILVLVASITSLGSLFFAYQTKKLNIILALVLFYLATLIAIVFISDMYHLYFAITYSITTVLIGMWLIREGIKNGISQYFFLGILAILIIAFIRYIDLVQDYVSSAILLMVFAMMLVGAAKYWRSKTQIEVKNEK